MSFFKRLFQTQTSEGEPTFIDYLEKINTLLRPSINPKDYQYSEFFLRNDFKFQTEHRYSLEQIREKTWITSLAIYKKKRDGVVWKGSIKELRNVYASPTIQFAMNELTPLLQKMKTTKHNIEHFESIIEYEETIQNVYDVLSETRDKEDANAVLIKSIELLRHVIRSIQVEFRKLEQEETNELLDRLTLEEKYMKRNNE